MEKIFIVCACDNHFLPFTASMLASVFENNKALNIEVILLHNINHKARVARLKKFVTSYGYCLTDFYITQEEFRDLPVSGAYPNPIYYRLMLPEILPNNIKKVIYLDSDLITRENLLELWNLNIDTYPIAAVDNDVIDNQRISKFNIYRYFNSGVMLINIDYWRNEDIHTSVLGYIRENKDKLMIPDQDALNAVLHDHWYQLPVKWNVMNYFFRNAEKNSVYALITKNPSIVHFTGPGKFKPWHPKSTHPFKDEYRHYQKLTPWKYYWYYYYRGMTFVRLKGIVWKSLRKQSKCKFINILRHVFYYFFRFIYKIVSTVKNQ